MDYKLNSLGTIEWQKCLGGTSDDLANCINQTIDGGYIIAGFSNSIDNDVTGNHNSDDYWIVKLDANGTIEWQKSLGGTFYDAAWFIQQTTDLGYIITGYSLSMDGDVTGNHGNGDCWIVKLNSLGGIEWQKCLGGTSIDNAHSIQQTTDDGFIIGGFSDSNDGDVTGNHGNLDYWIIKLNSTVNVNELQNPISNFQITPNPFSTATNISFQLTSSKGINFEIRDIEGRLIKTLNPKNLNYGLNEIFWDASDNAGSKVSDGIYFVNIITENFCESKKVVVLRN